MLKFIEHHMDTIEGIHPSTLFLLFFGLCLVLMLWLRRRSFRGTAQARIGTLPTISTEKNYREHTAAGTIKVLPEERETLNGAGHRPALRPTLIADRKEGFRRRKTHTSVPTQP